MIKLWQIARLRRFCRDSKAIILTYDDGPGRVLTPILLNVLASNNVHASFFMIGCKVKSFSSLVQDVIANGHDIGSHSFRHLHAWKNNPIKVARDIQTGFQISEQIASYEPISNSKQEKLPLWEHPPNNLLSNNKNCWFRPPFGKITLATLLHTWITHHKLAWWTIDSTDTWASPLPIETIIERVRNQGGGVILMHDNDRIDASMHNYVISLTIGLIQLARDEGYDICTFQNDVS